jgi:hypothetical protein
MIDQQARIANDTAILTRLAMLCFVFTFLVGVSTSLSAGESLMTLRKQTRELLKTEANSDDHQAKQSAATALCDMYVVLRSDSRYVVSPMLQGDAAKVRKRLMRISQRTETRLDRAKVSRPSDLEAKIDQVLARIADPNSTDPNDSDQQRRQQPAAAGGGATADEGWQLVELIQRVIAPDFWQPQGGPGVVRYFAIKRALVVRGTSDVHQQVRELLMALR